MNPVCSCFLVCFLIIPAWLVADPATIAPWQDEVICQLTQSSESAVIDHFAQETQRHFAFLESSGIIPELEVVLLDSQLGQEYFEGDSLSLVITGRTL